jgi:hypothetical protein
LRFIEELQMMITVEVTLKFVPVPPFSKREVSSYDFYPPWKEATGKFLGWAEAGVIRHFRAKHLQLAQNELGARRSMSGGILFSYVTRNRSSATKHIRLFQRVA